MCRHAFEPIAAAALNKKRWRRQEGVEHALDHRGILDIRPVSMNTFGGTGSGSIHLNVTGPLPRYRIIYAFKQVGSE